MHNQQSYQFNYPDLVACSGQLRTHDMGYRVAPSIGYRSNGNGLQRNIFVKSVPLEGVSMDTLPLRGSLCFLSKPAHIRPHCIDTTSQGENMANIPTQISPYRSLPNRSLPNRVLPNRARSFLLRETRAHWTPLHWINF